MHERSRHRVEKLTILFAQAGAFFGVILGSWIMDKYGRKVGGYYCALLSIFGGAGLCGARNIGMFIAFRFFAGAGSWGFLALSMLPFLFSESPFPTSIPLAAPFVVSIH